MTLRQTRLSCCQSGKVFRELVVPAEQGSHLMAGFVDQAGWAQEVVAHDFDGRHRILRPAIVQSEATTEDRSAKP